MGNLDYSDYINIKITRVTLDGEATHWELDITDGDGDVFGEGTGPNFNSMYDMAYSIIAGGDKHSNYEYNEWVEFDANNK